MISCITGKVQASKKQSISLMIGPIGVELWVPNGLVFQIGEEKTFFVSMHWNQEQGPSLYGFGSELEKAVFILVTSCSGIGPKIALAVLADLGAHAFLAAAQTGDERALSKVNGIGLKKAEQMIVQLKHKIGPLLEMETLDDVPRLSQWHTVVQALESLNYSRNEIHHAMNYLKKKPDVADNSFNQLLRQALSFLSKQS